MKYIYLVLMGLVLVGCKRQQSTPPATHPASTQPATPITLSIQGQCAEFPPAILTLQKNEDHLIAFLVTNDSKEGEENSICLSMDLDINDPADLPSTQWTYQSTSTEPVDSAEGILLGNEVRLQPMEVSATFEVNGTIHLSGKFLAFDQSNPAAEGKVVNVEGTIPANLEK